MRDPCPRTPYRAQAPVFWMLIFFGVRRIFPVPYFAAGLLDLVFIIADKFLVINKRM